MRAAGDGNDPAHDDPGSRDPIDQVVGLRESALRQAGAVFDPVDTGPDRLFGGRQAVGVGGYRQAGVVSSVHDESQVFVAELRAQQSVPWVVMPPLVITLITSTWRSTR